VSVATGHSAMWHRNAFLCQHGRRQSKCKECGGAFLCRHAKRTEACLPHNINEHLTLPISPPPSVQSYGPIEPARQTLCTAPVGYVREITLYRGHCKCPGEDDRFISIPCGGHAKCEHGRSCSFCRICREGIRCKHGVPHSTCVDNDCGGIPWSARACGFSESLEPGTIPPTRLRPIGGPYTRSHAGESTTIGRSTWLPGL